MKCQYFLYLFINFYFVFGIYGQDSLRATILETPPPAIELRTYVQENEVPANRQVIFHLELSWVGSMSRYQILPIPQPGSTNLMLESSSASNKREVLPSGQYRCIKTATYYFKPVDLGMSYIDALEIKYQDAATNEIDQLFSQRLAVKIIDPIPEAGGRVKALVYIILLAIFAIAIIYFLILFFKKRSETEVVTEKVASLAEIYHSRLAKDVDPKGGNLPEMTILLSKIFREYLSKEFQVPITEPSDKTILEKLQSSGVGPVELKKLEELFKKLSVIKFAGGNVNPSEFSIIYGIVENFLFDRKNNTEPEKV